MFVIELFTKIVPSWMFDRVINKYTSAVRVQVNLFNVPFLYPLKMSENQRFSDIFRGYKNGTLA